MLRELSELPDGAVKPSRYNHALAVSSDTTIFFNFYTLNLLEAKSERASVIRDILDDPNREDHDPDIHATLRKAGFLIPEEIDEIEMLRAANVSARNNPRHLALTIAPTLACNFRCTYCYQTENAAERMSPEVQEALLEFVKRRTVPGGSFHVTWFGGEPLLCPDIIESLSQRFIEYCDDNEITYTASIITNGYLLDLPMARKLASWKVGSAQITLDGPSEWHDHRRLTKSGAPTFDRILDNICESSGAIKISIRMNVDRHNREHIDEMLDILCKRALEQKVGFYLGQVLPYTDVCADVSGACLSDEQFSLLGLMTLMKMSDRGFASSFQLPRASNATCIADNANGFVITPTGGIVKCWNEISNTGSECSHLLSPVTQEMGANLRRWMERDPFELECRECQLLPMCMGGCPYFWLHDSRLACTRWKYRLDESLLYYYFVKKKEQENAISRDFAGIVESLKQSGASDSR